MSTDDRLPEIEKNLKMLRNQRHALEQEAILTTGLAKTQAEQRLQEQINPQIRKYEQEYWQVFARQVKTVEIAEAKAEIIVGEIVEDLGQIELQGQHPDRVLQLLQEIRDAVNKPGSTAGLKLKGVISPIPPFVAASIEGELDADQFVRQHFPTFQKWAQVLTKKS